MRLIWCQGGNPAPARIACAAGWWYGFRSDAMSYPEELGPVALLDCKWVNPDWRRHVAAARRVRPLLAAVPDILEPGDVPLALRRAEELAPWCGAVLLIPKCCGVIGGLPAEAGGKPVVLGYSVPTGYGGAEVPLWEFSGRPVHLLGGNPRSQRELCDYLRVVSADGNLAWRLARRGIVVDQTGVAGPTLRERDGRPWGEGAHLEALRRTMENLRAFWSRTPGVRWRA